MRLRTILGFGIGYLAGVKADPKKFEDLKRLFNDVVSSETFKESMKGARQAVASGVEMVTGEKPEWASEDGESGGESESQSSSSSDEQSSEEEEEEESSEASQSKSSSEGKQQQS